jgi:hypothetical protein
MFNPETTIQLHKLGQLFKTTFDEIVKRDRLGDVQDIAEAWVDLTASVLQNVQLMSPPVVHRNEPFLPFIHIHRIRTEVFNVARGGMRGGPVVDVLLQIWFETEEVTAAFGVPIVIRRIPSSGPMPSPMFEELQDTARKLTLATPSGRLMFFADKEDFEWGEKGMFGYHPIIVVNAHSFAGLRRPPHPVTGREHDHFSDDLASGWIGDPALSSRETSPILDEVFSNFLVNHVLRIHIEKAPP